MTRALKASPMSAMPLAHRAILARGAAQAGSAEHVSGHGAMAGPKNASGSGGRPAGGDDPAHSCGLSRLRGTALLSHRIVLNAPALAATCDALNE
jgi:hypothetical protein